MNAFATQASSQTRSVDRAETDLVAVEIKIRPRDWFTRMGIAVVALRLESAS
jgi:hypothetical protein